MQSLVSHLAADGHEVEVLGDLTGSVCDYPDSAYAVASLVSAGGAERGILICGTGIGMCIAANKVKGIRAALALDELSAQLSRTHNDARRARSRLHAEVASGPRLPPGGRPVREGCRRCRGD